MSVTEADPRIRNSPVYWFAVMEDARRLGQFTRAEQARRELERLGVRVRYRPPYGRAPPVGVNIPSSSVRGYTVRDIARRYRVGEDKVRNWIKRGELSAIDTADKRRARPRYVILPEALVTFERGRQAATPRVPKPKRTKRVELVDFYPD
jgi:hypothetical protein